MRAVWNALSALQNRPSCLNFSLIEISKFHCNVFSSIFKRIHFPLYFGLLTVLHPKTDLLYKRSEQHWQTSSQQQILKVNPRYTLRFYLVPYFLSIIANQIFCSVGYAVHLKLTRKQTTTHNQGRSNSPFKGIIQTNKMRKTGLNFPNKHTLKNPNKNMPQHTYAHTLPKSYGSHLWGCF